MKKHVKLYNRMWKALHKDDKFVIVSDLNHDQIVKVMADAIGEVFRKASPPTYEAMAEAALEALQCPDDGYVAGLGAEVLADCERPAEFRLGVGATPQWFADEVVAGRVRLIMDPAGAWILRAVIEARSGKTFVALAGDVIVRLPNGELTGRPWDVGF